MDLYTFHLKIIDEDHGVYRIKISDKKMSTIIDFDYEKRKLDIKGHDEISNFLKTNAYQMNKILRNKRRNTFYIGFSLTIVLWDEKDVAAFNDKSKIIVLDQLDGHRKCKVVPQGKEHILKVYTDGSFNEKNHIGGYSFIIKDLKGNYDLYKFQSKSKSSSLIELEAAIHSLEILKDKTHLRIITDAQYVRKGLTEWIINWKLNDWKTANGTPVKNKSHWLKFDALAKGKYIEFEWVKGHSMHFENTLADLYAEEMTTDN